MEDKTFTNELQAWAIEHHIDDILKTENINTLKSLDVSFKKLDEIPPFIFALSSLQSLNLSHNNLHNLPVDILKLKSLRELNISWNHITHDLEFIPKNIKINSAWNRQ